MRRSLRHGLFLALALSVSAAATPTRVAAAAPLARAPHFHLAARNGIVDSDSLNARAVVVDFWASWCVPCRRSFPWLAQLDAKYKDRGLAIVAIDVDKERVPALAFLEKFPAPFTVAFDPDGDTAEAFRVKGMPTTYLLAPDGTVVMSHAGFDDKSAAAMAAQIERMLTP